MRCDAQPELKESCVSMMAYKPSNLGHNDLVFFCLWSDLRSMSEHAGLQVSMYSVRICATLVSTQTMCDTSLTLTQFCVEIAIPDIFSNPGISGLKNANPGI